MVHDKNRIPYWIDRRLNGLAGPEYDATISFGLPFALGDCQYGNSRLNLPLLYYGFLNEPRAPCYRDSAYLLLAFGLQTQLRPLALLRLTHPISSGSFLNHLLRATCAIGIKMYQREQC